MQNQEKIARVSVNGIEIGSIPADHYQAVLRVVDKDKMRLVKQALNTLTSCALAIKRIFLISTAFLVAGFITTLMLDGAFAATLISNFRTLSPNEVVASMRFLILIATLFGAVLVLADLLMWPTRYGYINYRDIEINRMVRRMLEVPTEGVMSVVVEGDVSRHVQ